MDEECASHRATIADDTGGRPVPWSVGMVCQTASLGRGITVRGGRRVHIDVMDLEAFIDQHKVREG